MGIHGIRSPQLQAPRDEGTEMMGLVSFYEETDILRGGNTGVKP